jgi:tRNA nucleotidyltransferase/poly(A) polymerase
LRSAGYVAYWAGGCVRDELLGRTPKDYDVATNATPAQVVEVFGQRRTLAVGASFGVMIVRGPRAAGQLDVATFREDAGYSDGRHPDAVSYSTPERDAQRRDFTINGLFFDPLTEEVFDYVGGLADLRQGVVRAIGDARARFAEDKLRMLRAVRFTAVFGFELESATRAAIGAMAAELNVVSPERIGMELRSMLLHESRARSLALLREVDLLPQVLPELSALAAASPDRWQETLRVLAALNEPTIATALAALLLELVQANKTLPSNFATAVAQRLRWTNKEGQRTQWLLHNIERMSTIDLEAWPRSQRLLIEEGLPELLQLYAALTGAESAQLAWCREKLALPAEKLNPAPLITGSDLKRHGLAPGPAFKTLLESIRDAQLRGEIQTPAEALQLAASLLSS